MVYFTENYNFRRFHRGSNIFQGGGGGGGGGGRGGVGPPFSRGVQLFPRGVGGLNANLYRNP